MKYILLFILILALNCNCEATPKGGPHVFECYNIATLMGTPPGVVISLHGVVHRCENKEIVCYFYRTSHIDCKWKGIDFYPRNKRKKK